MSNNAKLCIIAQKRLEPLLANFDTFETNSTTPPAPSPSISSDQHPLDSTLPSRDICCCLQKMPLLYPQLSAREIHVFLCLIVSKITAPMGFLVQEGAKTDRCMQLGIGEKPRPVV